MKIWHSVFSDRVLRYMCSRRVQINSANFSKKVTWVHSSNFSERVFLLMILKYPEKFASEIYQMTSRQLLQIQPCQHWKHHYICNIRSPGISTKPWKKLFCCPQGSVLKIRTTKNQFERAPKFVQIGCFLLFFFFEKMV